MSRFLQWAMIGEDTDCYGLIDESGYVLKIEDGLWRWRTDYGVGYSPTRDDAMYDAQKNIYAPWGIL